MSRNSIGLLKKGGGIVFGEYKVVVNGNIIVCSDKEEAEIVAAYFKNEGSLVIISE